MLKAVMEPVASEVSKVMLSREEAADAREVIVVVTGMAEVFVTVMVDWARARVRRVVRVGRRVDERMLVVLVRVVGLVWCGLDGMG